MGQFERAVRQMREDALECPACQALNKPAPAKPTIEIDPNGRATCDECGHVWYVNKEK